MIYRPPGFNRPRYIASAVLASAVLVAGGVVVAGTVASGSSYRQTETYFSQAQQSGAEAQVATFASTHPMPKAERTSGDTFGEYQAELRSYYEQVPWTEVYAQWDCRITSEPEVSAAPNSAAGGADTTFFDVGYICGDTSFTSTANINVETKSSYLDREH